MQAIFADFTESVTNFKASPTRAIKSAEGKPVAILLNNKPLFYAVPAELFEQIADHMDSLELAEVIRERLAAPEFVEVQVDDL